MSEEEIAKNVWISRTPHGWHLYFKTLKIDNERSPIFINNKDGKRVFELYFHDRFFLEEPSVIDGNKYSWLTDIKNVPISELKEDFFEILERYQKYLPLIEYCPPLWTDGQRHDFALNLSGACRKKGIKEEETRWIVNKIAKTSGDAEDRERTVKDTYSKTIDDVTGYNGLKRLFGEDTAKKIDELIPDERPEEERNKKSQSVQERIIDLTKRVMSRHRFRMVDDELYLYSDGIYTAAGKETIKKIIEEEDGEELNAYIVNETIGHVERRSYPDDKDKTDPPEFLPVANGLLNLDSLRLEPFNPDLFFRFKLPVAYEPAAECTKFKKILSEILEEDENKIKLIQEIFGYCLFKGMPAQKSFWIYGPAASGKTTVFKILGELLGKENVSSLDMQEIEYSRFAVAGLQNKLANILGEPNPGELKKSTTFKKLTGGDIITADRKNKSLITFSNTAKLIIYANRYPNITDTGDAFWRRVIVLGFNHRFSEFKKDVWKEVTEDTAEMSGVLCWTIEGLKRLKDNDWTFTETDGDGNGKREFMLNANPKEVFLSEECIFDRKSWTANDDLWLAYSDWCEEAGAAAEEKDSFFKFINSQPGITSGKKTIGGSRRHVKIGIILAKNNDDAIKLSNLSSLSGGSVTPNLRKNLKNEIVINNIEDIENRENIIEGVYNAPSSSDTLDTFDKKSVEELKKIEEENKKFEERVRKESLGAFL
jgi:putative DNA primase/helicase